VTSLCEVTIHMNQLKYSDWTFLAEGNAHIVYRSNLDHSLILRIPKQIRLDRTQNTLFFDNILTPVFPSKYLNRPVYATIDSTFISNIQSSIVNPSTKLKSRRTWNTSHLISPWMAEILHNSNYIPRLIHINSENIAHISTLSFEFKVKCGIKSTSPYIPPSSRIKLNMSRYELIQSFKAMETNRPLLFKYNPRDLCSQNKDRITASIRELVASPANNLTIRLDGVCVHPSESEEELLTTFANFLSTDASSAIPYVSDIISDILIEEDVLHRLELLQAVDLIDVEGAYQIMMRLEHLAGSSEDALSALQGSIGLPLEFSLLELCDHCWSIRNRYEKESYYTSLSDHIDAKERYGGVIAELLDMQIHSCIADEELAMINTRAMLLTDTLDEHDCIVLLRLFLLSLTAKDASVIIAMERNSESNKTSIDFNNVDHISLLHKTGVHWKYSIKLLDINCKPPSKVLNKIEKEYDICRKLTAARSI
jgi:Inositol-pentakisphosphate 2-kinase